MQQKSNHNENHSHDHSHSKQKASWWFWVRCGLICLVFAYFVAINVWKPTSDWKWTWHFGIWFPITSYVVFWEGRQYLRIYYLMYKRIVNMDTLIGLASHILYLYSFVSSIININEPMFSYDVMWEGSAILIVFTNIGHKLEDQLTRSTLEIYHKLQNMKNSEVLVQRNNEWIKTNAKEVNIGEVILVKHGNFVPLDGVVLNDAEFDYSNITGESKPVAIKANKGVISGSYNLSNNVSIKVTKLSNDTTINHVINKIEEVSSLRPPMQQLADKILRFFIPGVLLLSFLTFVIWLIIGYTTTSLKLPWINSDNNLENAIKAGVTVIAIACPCALGIATPLVYTVSSMLASVHGMVINEPRALEEVNKIQMIAFDKTGTITSNRMQISKVHGDETLLPIAKALEDNINHPIAESIVQFIKAKPASVSKIVQLPNQGVKGVWDNKQVFISKYIGKEFNVDDNNTCIALYVDNKPKLVLELTNEIRKDVEKTIKKFNRKGIDVVMITGDNQTVANNIASQVGIKKVYANVTPNDKAQIIKEIQKEYRVLFVGDGFNDAVAIKQANVSLAFGSGSDITNSLADVSIVNNEFIEIFDFFKLGKMNEKKVKISLTYAFAFNIITIPIAMLLLVQPWVGASIMAISDILVAINAFLYKSNGLRRLKHETK